MNSQKVILVTIDGLRPDAFLTCGHPMVDYVRKNASYTVKGSSVLPPMTLPAHLSIFYSVPPQRHGTLTNTYTPPVRPIDGLFEHIRHAGKTTAIFYGWEQMRDVSRPGSMTYAEYVKSKVLESADTYLTDRALLCIREHEPDFVFLYMVDVDECGHRDGWMTESYFNRIRIALDNLKRVLDACKDQYTVIVSADHGGHERNHGENIPEDMTIPMFFFGEMFEPGKEPEGLSLLDIAPTVAKAMGIPADPDWEGKSVF